MNMTDAKKIIDENIDVLDSLKRFEDSLETSSSEIFKLLKDSVFETDEDWKVKMDEDWKIVYLDLNENATLWRNEVLKVLIYATWIDNWFSSLKEEIIELTKALNDSLKSKKK